MKIKSKDIEYAWDVVNNILWVIALLFLVSLAAGCAVMPEDLSLQTHEEKHCEGWVHQNPSGSVPFIYEWSKTRPASLKPWFYVKVDDPNITCRMLGSQASQRIHIDACAIWKPQGCEIYLPKE